MAEDAGRDDGKYGGRVTAYIKEHGWVQKRYHDYATGAVCLAGALEGAYASPGECVIFNKLYSDLLRFANVGVSDKEYVALSQWNDEPGRTVEQVYELLGKVGA